MDAMLTVILWTFACFVPAQAVLYSTGFANVTWDDANWRLTTTYPDQGHYQGRASLANGYIGINLAALGPLFEADTQVNGDNINGWPLFDRRQTFGTVSGFWNLQPTTNGTNYEWLNALGGESVISGLPHWAGLVVQSGDHQLDASTDLSQITGFSSTLDMGAGLLSWRYTWTPPGSPAFDIEYSTFLHKLYVNQAITQLKITSSRNANVTVADVLDGDGALRTKFVDKKFETKTPSIWTAVQPHGIPDVTAYVYSTLVGDSSVDMSSRKMVTGKSWTGKNDSSIAQTVTVSLAPGNQVTIEKYVGIASTDAFEQPQATAKNASTSAASKGYVKLLASHISEWQSIMTADTVDSYHYAVNGSLPDDPNIIEQQISSIVNPFFLLQNTVGSNAIKAANNNTELAVNSIAVGGLSSDSYAGLIFWDAEVWMAPGLVVAYPDAASQIANYRAAKLPTAKKNIKEAYTSSQNKTHFSPDSAIFPWTSGRFGNCTGTGPCFDYEYHINGDIGLELLNYYVVTGDEQKFKDDYFPVFDAVASVYADLLHLDKSSGKRVLYNATDPDEYANNVNNPGYTMVLMKQHINMANSLRSRFNMPVNKTWSQIAADVLIPTNNSVDIILEYSGMNGTIEVKQADVVLVDDLLDYPNPYTLTDLDFYAGRQSPNGPGMTYGVFSVVAASASPSGCSAYTYQLYSSQPYTRGPWYQYSEQLLDDYTANGGTHPAYPFLTGMGGANRVAIFAYLGLRLKLSSLNVNPTLPPQIPHLRYRQFYWQGYAIKAVANQTHTTLTRLSQVLENANPAYKNKAIPVTIGNSTKTQNLQPKGTLVFKNRRPDLVQTVSGNIAQCKPATSSEHFEPGQFPLAAVDGASATRWQPQSASESSTLIVDLGSNAQPRITGFAFDWAQNPPKSYSVSFSNNSDTSNSDGRRQVASSKSVKISDPYDPKTAFAIQLPHGNTTNVTLSNPVYGGRYAFLTIQGNQGNKSTEAPGATVAEWSILASHK